MYKPVCFIIPDADSTIPSIIKKILSFNKFLFSFIKKIKYIRIMELKTKMGSTNPINNVCLNWLRINNKLNNKTYLNKLFLVITKILNKTKIENNG